jgi:Ca-activated chloride channel family protein
MKSIFVTAFILFVFSGIAYSQTLKPTKEPPKTTRILFVLDASGSMLAPWEGRPRWDVAKEVLTKIMDSVSRLPNTQTALRIYGHQFSNKDKNCKDSKLELNFSSNQGDAVKAKLNNTVPKGVTPIAYSLEQATNDFPEDANMRNVIVLITDGIESCQGDPCAISLGLQKKGIFLKPFIIGMGIEKNYADAFNCMGRFVNAKDPVDFMKAMREVSNQILGKTTVKVELLDESGGMTEKDVNFAFINQVTQKANYNIVHFRDGKGATDELEIDAVPTYDLVVYTVPPVFKKDVEIIGGRPNIIKVKTPRGNLLVNQKGFASYSKELKAIVRLSGKNETLIAAQVSEPQNLLTGSYDVEVLTLPRVYYNNVKIKQGQTTTIEVPSPGVLTIQNKVEGFASIYQIDKDGRQEWVTNLLEKGVGDINVALQPGDYLLVYRPKNVTGSEYTKRVNFSIASGQTHLINIFRLN